MERGSGNIFPGQKGDGNRGKLKKDSFHIRGSLQGARWKEEVKTRLFLEGFPEEFSGKALLFLEELWKWNKVYNLTGVKDPVEIFEKLFLESLAAHVFIPEGSRVMDFGSGPGIPGIPIKLLRDDVSIDLVERRKKKATFIRYVLRLLGVENARVLERDLRGSEEDLGESYQVVVSRAVMDPRELFNVASFYLEKGGIFIGFSSKASANTCLEFLGKEVFFFVKRKD